MKLLVTGGFGFIGSHYVDKAVSSGHEVYVIDKLTYASNLRNLADVREKIAGEFFLDLAHRDALIPIFEKCGSFDAIVNFAAESHVDRSIKTPGLFFESNVTAVVNLLECLRSGGAKRMVQISTDEVYGSIESGNWQETSNLDPRSPYSASKASADLICKSYANTFGVDVAITRSSNNFGPRQSVEKFIPKSILAILNDQPIEIYGQGNNMREWISVYQNVSYIHKIVEANDLNFDTYNIGGLIKTNLEVISELREVTGHRNHPVRFINDRPGHDFRYSVDSKRVIEEFGSEASMSLTEGLSDTFEWYLRNTDWVNESLSRLMA